MKKRTAALNVDPLRLRQKIDQQIGVLTDLRREADLVERAWELARAEPQLSDWAQYRNIVNLHELSIQNLLRRVAALETPPSTRRKRQKKS